MTDKLDLPHRYRDQLEALLREHVPGVEVWVYGSPREGREPRGQRPGPSAARSHPGTIGWGLL